jgi:hypothetical protein
MSGIKILKAVYGSGNKTVDVSPAVSSNIKDGTLSLVVTPDSLNVEDPAPGQQKSLELQYTINNGDINGQIVKDNEMVMISAPPERRAVGLQITKAEYGYPGNFTDVTDAIQSQIKNGSINVNVSPRTAGIPDPNPNKQKTLEVEYTINGSKNLMSVKDGKPFKISAPPSDSSVDAGITSFASVIGTAFSNLFSYSLIAIGAVAAYTYGNLFNKYVGWFFGGISLTGGGFWGVCLFALFYPLYSGKKLDLFPAEAIIPITSTA